MDMTRGAAVLPGVDAGVPAARRSPRHTPPAPARGARRRVGNRNAGARAAGIACAQARAAPRSASGAGVLWSP